MTTNRFPPYSFFKDELQNMALLCLGVLSATIGLEGFLIPNHFVDGGVMGISLIVESLTRIPLSVLVFAINLPFLILAFSSISRRFAIRSIIGIALLALFIQFLPVPVIAEDKILIAAFGGLFLGLGIGLSIRGGAIIDGTEVLAIFISRNSSLSVGNVILIFNIMIFGTAAYVFTTEIALYAILTYFTASKTIDFVIDGIEEYMGVLIVSDKHEEIRQALVDKLGRGCTLLEGKKGYSYEGGELMDTRLVYTVITRLEMSRLQAEISAIDPRAFVTMNSLKDARGGMVKSKPITKLK
jgi:uncharacterized membrane-anchored protein YitT (DUF2179 family)